MKTIKYIQLSLIILILASCKKDEVETTNIFFNNIDFNKVIETSDGYVIVGSSQSILNQKDFLIAKFDKNLDKLWSYSYEIPFNQYGNSVIESNDGFVAVGAAESEFGDSSQLMVIKVDNSGELEWANFYIKDYQYSFGTDITYSITNGFIVSGGYNQVNANQTNLFVINISEEGDSISMRILPGYDVFYGNNIITSNDYYYLSINFGMLQLNSSLLPIDYFSGEEINCNNTKILSLSENKIVFYGNTNSYSSIFILFENNQLVWSKEYKNMQIQSISAHRDNELFAVGKINDSYFDKLLITNIDSEGTITFTKTFASNPEEIRYDRSGIQVFNIDDNHFLIWEKYNGNKLNVYTVDKNGEKN